ncbi:MAG TPA: response regulator [Bacteroidales bacterium]|nr:response regulator [Bacteroidales bacterium]
METRSNILLVDDRPENITALMTLLEDIDVNLVTANSGNEALARTLDYDFALALIDVQMPGMDGYETVRLMRLVEKTKYLPVIFISAVYSHDQYEVQGIEAGAVDFITKPFDSRVLLGKIRVFLELHRQRRLLETEIEQRIKVEERLREAKAKAEESDRLKTAFLANMSHEIRTPLTTIVGMANLLARNNYEPEKKKELAGYIDKSSKSLLTIINDILDLSRIEAGEVLLSRQPVNINGLMESLYQSYTAKVSDNERDIEIRLSVPQKHFFTVTDENRLRQILTNLLDNSLKFTHKGFIELGYAIKKDSVEFFVSDTGEGIPPEKISSVFDRFRKLNQNTRGTGLGLSIVKRLAEILGGTVDVTSEVDKGTTFRVTIPLKEEEGIKVEKPREVQSEFIPDWSSRSILIAEDEYTIYLLLEAILAPTRIRITWAKDGREAIDAIASDNDFDLALFDIKMPWVDGREAFMQIRKFNSRIPIIAQTAFAMDDEKNQLEKMGFNGFITKPFIKDEILNVIEHFISLEHAGKDH